jgi:hypothetical protein
VGDGEDVSVGSGERLGEGVGSPVALGVGVGVGAWVVVGVVGTGVAGCVCVRVGPGSAPPYVGSGKSVTGSPRRTFDMYSAQICAGNVPP